MSKPVVFVIGATGNIGTATVSALAAKYADKIDIRAGVRNPDKADKLKAITGVSLVQATMGDKDQLSKTLSGVNTLYIVTPGVENRAELAIATATAAKSAGVKHIAVVSVLTAELTDTIFGRQFDKIEKEIKALGVPYTFLRLPLFMENLWGFKDGIVGQNSMYGPVDGDKDYTPVAVEDAGKAGAAVLANPEAHANKTYNIVSNRHTFNAAAKAFSEALGREIKYVRVPYDAAKKAFMGMGFPEWQVDGILELDKLIDSGSPVTNQADLSTFNKLTGEQPTDLKTWVTKNAPGFK